MAGKWWRRPVARAIQGWIPGCSTICAVLVGLTDPWSKYLDYQVQRAQRLRCRLVCEQSKVRFPVTPRFCWKWLFVLVGTFFSLICGCLTVLMASRWYNSLCLQQQSPTIAISSVQEEINVSGNECDFVADLTNHFTILWRISWGVKTQGSRASGPRFNSQVLTFFPA